MRRIVCFLRCETGGTTVEFVAIMFSFVIVTFMILEIALALFWWQTAQKAAQVGARWAIISDWIVTAPAATFNTPSSGTPLFGAPCDISQGASDPCYNSGFTTSSCTGSACANQKPFSDVYCRMKAVLPNLQPSNVTVTYTYAGVGFVGGPLEPAVTVEVSNVPFPSGFADVLGSFFGSALSTIPPMAATLIAEDLSTQNLGTSGTLNTGGSTC
ncbi:MAG: pilus assembly protein [Alphaproteobacteria bacterium]|nr:pilus assembly protein [Alphaproteobacteria bacterium]